ncbi:cytochrome P450 [Roridomyces roridus]|uniref:Cytochrome P450 n=1 Tax=Roridomyces roridus TaxID=1738132 RepID=A0AAD7B6G4_9AGAR|nr:cytochrome P450 [Roridomyces roridus]
MSLDSKWAALLAVGAIVLIYPRVRKTSGPPLPPGPRPLPLIGNVLDIPSQDHWIKFTQLADVWGDIFSLTAFGQTMVIVNSLKIAEDFLDVRGANFSDRPIIPMGGELMGFNNVLSISQYGDRVRTERKLFHQLFGTRVSILNQFGTLIESEIKQLLRNVGQNEDDVVGQISRFTGGLTLRIAYGYHLVEPPQIDPFLHMFDTAGHNYASASKPAAFLVDILPTLRYWPAWLPGGGFHTIARAWRKQLFDTTDMGYEYVKKQMAAGPPEPSFVSTSLDEGVHDEYLIKWAAISIQAGGADTSSSQIEGFLLAMALHPEIQRTAQKELDAVVGPDRLPDINDRASLPYVDALCKEVLRWHVVTPTGIPHRAREDFVYERGEGLSPLMIPKGALVIPNIWKMTHDANHYTRPMEFDPTRFLSHDGKKAETDPTRMCFGFGRRICPGKLLADTTLFLTCSAILSVFDISFLEPSSGSDHIGQTSGTVSHPLPFKCRAVPRSTQAKALVRG